MPPPPRGRQEHARGCRLGGGKAHFSAALPYHSFAGFDGGTLGSPCGGAGERSETERGVYYTEQGRSCQGFGARRGRPFGFRHPTAILFPILGVYLRSQKCWDIRQKAPDARRMSAALLCGMQANATQQMVLFGRIDQRWGIFRYTLHTGAEAFSRGPLLLCVRADFGRQGRVAGFWDGFCPDASQTGENLVY